VYPIVVSLVQKGSSYKMRSYVIIQEQKEEEENNANQLCLNYLPSSLLHEILSFYAKNPQGIVHFSSICKEWKEIADNSTLWLTMELSFSLPQVILTSNKQHFQLFQPIEEFRADIAEVIISREIFPEAKQHQLLDDETECSSTKSLTKPSLESAYRIRQYYMEVLGEYRERQRNNQQWIRFAHYWFSVGKKSLPLFLNAYSVLSLFMLPFAYAFLYSTSTATNLSTLRLDLGFIILFIFLLDWVCLSAFSALFIACNDIIHDVREYFTDPFTLNWRLISLFGLFSLYGFSCFLGLLLYQLSFHHFSSSFSLPLPIATIPYWLLLLFPFVMLFFRKFRETTSSILFLAVSSIVNVEIATTLTLLAFGTELKSQKLSNLSVIALFPILYFMNWLNIHYFIYRGKKENEGFSQLFFALWVSRDSPTLQKLLSRLSGAFSVTTLFLLTIRVIMELGGTVFFPFNVIFPNFLTVIIGFFFAAVLTFNSIHPEDHVFIWNYLEQTTEGTMGTETGEQVEQPQAAAVVPPVEEVQA
jgi:hypothetical protein